MVATAAGTADLANLTAQMFGAGRRAQSEIQDFLVDAGHKIEAKMKEYAPVKTGALRAAIRVEAQPMRVTIGPQGIDYAVYQEFGTGIRGEFKTHEYVIRPKTAQYLTFKINGRWVHTKMVVHPGIPAHPYARPALRDFLDSLGPDAAKVGVNIITGPNA